MYQSEWPDTKIRLTALRYMKKHMMDPTPWRYTLVGNHHSAAAALVQLRDNESSLVSFWSSDANWYLLSTRRVIGAYAGKNIDVHVLEITESRFGDFKGTLGADLETMSLRTATGVDVMLQYETGPASMAPIYYFRYWRTKYPVLDKLTA